MTTSKIAKMQTLQNQARAAKMRKRAAWPRHITQALDATPGGVAYAVAHPRERVVVQGQRYSVIIPELESSKISDHDLKAVMRELVK